MIFRRTFLTLVTCSTLLALAPVAGASSSASEFVREKHSKLVDLVKAGKPDAEVDKVFSQVLDYTVLAEASLGNHWADRSDAERKEFTELLAKLVRISYRKNIRKTLGYKVEYKGTDKGEAGDIVHTIASSTNAREEPVSIDYVVRDLGQGPRIVDVVTEGSSMVNNYRSSFNRIMKKGGFQDVLKRMRAKVAGGGAGGVD